MNQQTLSKKITVTNLTSRTVNPKPGQMFQPFTVYIIVGNDGVSYESSDATWYQARKVGELLDVNYYVESKNAANGKVYTHYKVVTQKAPASQDNTQLLDAMRKLYEKMEVIERNIIAAIEMNGSDLDLSPTTFLSPTDTPSEIPYPEEPSEEESASSSLPF